MKNNTLYHDQRPVDPKRYKKKVDSWENSQMQLENIFKKISEVTTDAVLLTKPKLGTHDFFKALQLGFGSTTLIEITLCEARG